MSLGRVSSSSRRHCVDPSLDPPQESRATSQTGQGIGNSHGCYKPENQRTCGVGSAGNPVPGTARAEWEKEYGKLRTEISWELVPICGGHAMGKQIFVRRVPDPTTIPKEKKRVRCCSIRYKACPTNC
jgi:hypothetical protein